MSSGTYPRTEETREKMSKNSGSYKGDKAGKNAIHRWVEKNKPKPKICEICGKEKDHLGHTRLVLANLNNHIYRRDVNDFKYGHYSCHSKIDYPDGMKGINLKSLQKWQKII
jgi:hypothetical protein